MSRLTDAAETASRWLRLKKQPSPSLTLGLIPADPHPLQIVNARCAFQQRRKKKGTESKKRNSNSRSLMQTVKNNNQKCSIREMRCLRLRVLQGGCTVITSPEDLGEESFHEKTEGANRRGG